MSIDYYKLWVNEKIILLGDINARIENEIVDGLKVNESVLRRNG